MRLRNKSLNAKGASTKRWEAYRNKTRSIVSKRSAGFCESCGDRVDALDWAHLFGRGNIVREPLASSPQFTAGLDRDCHNDIDRGVNLDAQEELRWDAIDMMIVALELKEENLLFGDPIEAAHYIERWCADQKLEDEEIMERCLR